MPLQYLCKFWHAIQFVTLAPHTVGRSILAATMPKHPLFWLDVFATKLATLACMQGRGSQTQTLLQVGLLMATPLWPFMGPVNLVRRRGTERFWTGRDGGRKTALPASRFAEVGGGGGGATLLLVCQPWAPCGTPGGMCDEPSRSTRSGDLSARACNTLLSTLWI